MNYYELLKLKPEASPDEIKQALSDAVRGFKSESELAEIEAAFDTLIYPSSRSQYDLSLGLQKPGENAVWRKYYHTYSNDFIERDRAYKNEVMPITPNSGNSGVRILVFLILLTCAGIAALGYTLLSDKQLVNKFKAQFLEKKKEELKVTGPVVDFPELSVLFPEQAAFIGQKLSNACAIPEQTLLAEGSEFAVYWVARFNCEKLAVAVLSNNPEFKTVSWGDKQYDPVAFAKLFGARAVAGIYEKYSSGRLQNLRVAPNNSGSQKEFQAIADIKAQIKKLENSIHFYKAERACANFSDLSGSNALLQAYIEYQQCLESEIRKEQDYRKSAGHSQIPE